MPLRAVSRSAPSSDTSSPAPPAASRRYIWSRSNFDGATLTYSSNTRVSSRPSSEAESRLGSTLSSITGLSGLPLYSADGLPVSELLTAPSSTSTSGVPAKAITAWRSCSPSRTVISGLPPSVATELGKYRTCGAPDEYTAMRDVSTSEEFTASVKASEISPVPRSMRAPRISGLLVTIARWTTLREGRSFPARSSKAPACVNRSSGDARAAAAAFCPSVRAITTVLPSDASASDAPPSGTGFWPAERKDMRDKSTFVEVLTSSSNVTYSRPRSRLKLASTAAGALLSAAAASRMICTWSPVNPVTAAYVDSPAVNVAIPLAPRRWNSAPPVSLVSHTAANARMSAGLVMLMICTPLHLALPQLSRWWSRPMLATAA